MHMKQKILDSFQLITVIFVVNQLTGNMVECIILIAWVIGSTAHKNMPIFTLITTYTKVSTQPILLFMVNLKRPPDKNHLT